MTINAQRIAGLMFLLFGIFFVRETKLAHTSGKGEPLPPRRVSELDTSTPTALLASVGSGPSRRKEAAHAVVLRTDRAAQPELEEALDIEDPDAEWTSKVQEQAQAILMKRDPAITVRSQCAQTFCRLEIRNPSTSTATWPQIDQLLAQVATGEAMMSTAPTYDGSIGYLYFSARDSRLPVGNVLGDREDD